MGRGGAGWGGAEFLKSRDDYTACSDRDQHDVTAPHRYNKWLAWSSKPHWQMRGEWEERVFT